MSIEEVRTAYGARAAEYVEFGGSIARTAPEDQADIARWGVGVSGPVLDVGSGPGQWTSFLVEHGVDARGVDPVPEFVESARQRFPNAQYEVGRAEALGVADGSIGGILAWYSLIHTEPDGIDDALDEFGRALRPGGSLLLGFFEGAALEPFPHAITRAWFWPVPLLCEHLERAGFAIADIATRTDPGRRPHGAITAVRGATATSTVAP